MLRTVSARLFAVVLAAALLVSCKAVRGTTDIKTLTDDPSRFDGQVVRIAGTVTHSIGALGYGAYEVDDGTGKLAVVSQGGGAPKEGAQVGVEGTFRNAFTVGTHSANALLEKKRFTPQQKP